MMSDPMTQAPQAPGEMTAEEAAIEFIGRQSAKLPINEWELIRQDLTKLLSTRDAAREAEIRAALAESVKLQSHYAELLNSYDGGKRITFADVDEWLERLSALKEERWAKSQLSSPAPVGPVTDEQIKHMVDRFLSWQLPENFSPDGGIIFEPIGNPSFGEHEFKRRPTGTNLLDYGQAIVMVRYMLEGLPREPTPRSEEQNK